MRTVNPKLHLCNEQKLHKVNYGATLVNGIYCLIVQQNENCDNAMSICLSDTGDWTFV